VMNINIKTLFFLSQAAARQFLKQKTGGKIINVASCCLFREAFGCRPIRPAKAG